MVIQLAPITRQELPPDINKPKLRGIVGWVG